MFVSDDCKHCQKYDMMFFSKCCCTSEYFEEYCNNCKWCDHIVYCFVQNNDVFVENNDDVNNVMSSVILKKQCFMKLIVINFEKKIIDFIQNFN